MKIEVNVDVMIDGHRVSRAYVFPREETKQLTLPPRPAAIDIIGCHEYVRAATRRENIIKVFGTMFANALADAMDDFVLRNGGV